MTSSEVCKIIKSCRENRVYRFSWSGLDLHLHEQEDEDYTSRTNYLQSPIVQQEELGDNDTEYFNPQGEISELKQRDLEELKIVDPLEYEKILHRGEI